MNTYYLFDKDGKLISEADNSGAIQKDYVYFGDRPVAQAVAADIYYYHVDHLNTPQIITDQTQQVVWAADYDPFGDVSITTQTIENNLRFPGQYYDGETGLHYNYFRDYEPALGRYVESDPIGLEDGVNTYAYVQSNPIANT